MSCEAFFRADGPESLETANNLVPDFVPKNSNSGPLPYFTRRPPRPRSSTTRPSRLGQDPRLNSPRVSESSTDEGGDQDLGIEGEFLMVSISPKAEFRSRKHTRPISDKDAAMEMERCFRRRSKQRHDHLAGRILRSLINRRAILDNDSLDNLLHAANKIFFDGKLSGRVSWQWSRPDQERYKHELLGTTALRYADPAIGGFETLIVLSEPLLRNQQYDRDLLLSAFLHELVHCYLFIRCGISHAMHDGHTEGFQKIARLINNWIGNHRLHLCHMRANLNLFQNRDVDAPARLKHFGKAVETGRTSQCKTTGLGLVA